MLSAKLHVLRSKRSTEVVKRDHIEEEETRVDSRGIKSSFWSIGRTSSSVSQMRKLRRILHQGQSLVWWSCIFSINFSPSTCVELYRTLLWHVHVKGKRISLTTSRRPSVCRKDHLSHLDLLYRKCLGTKHKEANKRPCENLGVQLLTPEELHWEDWTAWFSSVFRSRLTRGYWKFIFEISVLKRVAINEFQRWKDGNLVTRSCEDIICASVAGI